jgi:uncharacterized membrane protein YgcG
MHSTPGDGPREDEPEAQQTEQGTLDPFMASPTAPRAAPVRVTLAYAGVQFPKALGEAMPPAPPTTTQRSLDAFLASQAPTQAESAELSARAPRAMAGLALERAIERVAVREAATGITRDELIIIVARECEVPLEELTLVDSYISDLVLEGKLAIAGERIVLARRQAPVAKGKARDARGAGGDRAAKGSKGGRGDKGSKGGRGGKVSKGGMGSGVSKGRRITKAKAGPGRGAGKRRGPRGG